MKNTFPTYLFVSLLALSFGCSLDPFQDVEIDLPPYEKELVVESYLVPGQVYRCIVMETVPFFDSVFIPLVNDALVTISVRGEIDTLSFIGEGQYESTRMMTQDYEGVYRIDVRDGAGRHAWAETQLLPPVHLDSLVQVPLPNGKRKLEGYFLDEAGKANYYIYFAKADDEANISEFLEINDEAFDGVYYALPTRREYEVGREVLVRFMHVSQAYYDFTRTLDMANSVNSDVLQEPINVIDNVEGGLGIFTAFEYKEVNILIEE